MGTFCGNPETEIIADSVIVSGYTDPAGEGTTVTFSSPPRAVLDGTNSSTCMENGKWQPPTHDINCIGQYTY